MKAYATLLTTPPPDDHPCHNVKKPLVALGEDDPEIRDALASILSSDGYEVAVAYDGEAMIDLLTSYASSARYPDIVVVDHRMSGYSGLEILDGLGRAGWDIPVILITAYAVDIETLAQGLGARAVFQKPFDVDDFRTAIAYVLDSIGRGVQESELWKYALRPRKGSESRPS